MTFDCPMTNHRVSLDQSDSDESIKVNPRKQGCVSVEGIDVHSETMVDVSDCQEDKNEDKNERENKNNDEKWTVPTAL